MLLWYSKLSLLLQVPDRCWRCRLQQLVKDALMREIRNGENRSAEWPPCSSGSRLLFSCHE